MTAEYDIIFVADARFEGGTSTALAVEMKAAAQAGLKTGLLMVKGPILGLPFPVHQEIRANLDSGSVARIDPQQRVTTKLVIAHHPSIFQNYLQPRPAIVTERMIIVLHHPVVDRAGRSQYDLPTVVRHAFAAFSVRVILAPVSQVVRDTLPVILPEDCEILSDDWNNLIDLDDWPARKERQLSGRIRIGRHSRPDIQKWPDSFEVAKAIYPTDARQFSILMLGGGDFLKTKYGELPANWTLLPFSFTGVAEFLGALDFYVYFHSDAWSEAFGRTILEALAVGLVTILPEHFRPLFGDAALYAPPDQVAALLARYSGDQRLYVAQSRKARRFVEERHSARTYAARIAAHLDDIKRHPLSFPLQSPPFTRPKPQRRALFVSSNGIGMGHLAQQLAIADRLQPDITPVFATMSYALKVVIDAGYQAHYLNHHRSAGAVVKDWDKVFAEELLELITHVRPSIALYDATAVFPGIVDALSAFPDCFSIWVRRPMWRQSHDIFTDYSRSFDAVIEPGELADEFDQGPTKALQRNAYVVPPVLQIEPSQRLARALACKVLGVADDKIVVVLQLGAGNNYDLSEVRRTMLTALLRRPDVTVVELQSPIRNAPLPPAEDSRHIIRELYPAFKYSRAFDAAVSAAGYNSFHENILGGVPTLFVANEGGETDLQMNRSLWASLTGCGLSMRRDIDLSNVHSLIDRLLDPIERAAISERCKRIQWTNGAQKIADFVEDHIRLVRSDRWPGAQI